MKKSRSFFRNNQWLSRIQISMNIRMNTQILIQSYNERLFCNKREQSSEACNTTYESQKNNAELGMVAHACYCSIREAEAGGFPGVQGQPELHRLCLKKTNKNGALAKNITVTYFPSLQMSKCLLLQ